MSRTTETQLAVCATKMRRFLLEWYNSISEFSKQSENADMVTCYELDSSAGGTEGVGDSSPFSLWLRFFMTSSASNLPTSP